jgi:hypothetical protein
VRLTLSLQSLSIRMPTSIHPSIRPSIRLLDLFSLPLSIHPFTSSRFIFPFGPASIPHYRPSRVSHPHLCILSRPFREQSAPDEEDETVGYCYGEKLLCFPGATTHNPLKPISQPPTTPSNPSPNHPQLPTSCRTASYHLFCHSTSAHILRESKDEKRLCHFDPLMRRCTQLSLPSRVLRTFAFPCTSPSQRRVHRTADRRPAPRERTTRSEPPCPRFEGDAAFTMHTSQTSRVGSDGPSLCSAPGEMGQRSYMEYACTGTNRL